MTTTLFTNGRSQAVRIPKELRFEGREVSIRRLGDGVLLVPVKASTWPEGFFKSIRIDDANFTRPEQGELPPIVECDLVPHPQKVDMFATIFLNRRKRRMPNGGIEEHPFDRKHLAISAKKAGASARSSSVPSVTSCSNKFCYARLLLVPASPDWGVEIYLTTSQTAAAE
jgi:antitoxin VapB